MEYRKTAFKYVHKPLLWQQNTLNYSLFYKKSPLHSALSDPKYLFEDNLPDMSETKKIKLRNEKSENVNVVPQEFKETHKFVQIIDKIKVH